LEGIPVPPAADVGTVTCELKDGWSMIACLGSGSRDSCRPIVQCTIGNVGFNALLIKTSIIAWLDGCDLVIARMSESMFVTSCLEVVGAACSVFVGAERVTKVRRVPRVEELRRTKIRVFAVRFTYSSAYGRFQGSLEKACQ